MRSLPPKAAARFRKVLLSLAAIALVVFALLGWLVWEKLVHEYPQEFDEHDPLAALKYGSIGVEEDGGVPYWIWQVLPQIFPEYLPAPGGYTSLGMVWENGSEMPVGFTKRRIGYERVGINCAACHTGSYRLAPSDGGTGITQVVPGAPGNRLDVQGYLHFLSACANDPRFNADTILSVIEYNHKMSASDKVLYRYALIPGTKKALQKQAQGASWQQSRPAWGAGRIDPFNPVKFGMLGMDPANDPTIGNSDMMPLWMMQARSTSRGDHLHWDGLSTNLLDCSLAGALGDGATTKSLPVNKIQHIVEIARQLPPPKWPAAVDATLAAKGQLLFSEHCGRCHAPGSELVNRPVNLQDADGGVHITDGNRLAMWNITDQRGEFPYQIYNRFGDKYYWDLNSFVPTSSYISVPLHGLWLRAPYLHNGSVPSVADLLREPATGEQAREWIEAEQPGLFAWINSNLATYQKSLQVKPEEWRRLLQAVPGVVGSARAAGTRPPLFFRGQDTLDTARLGFICEQVDSAVHARPFVVATFIQGNSNAGHLYGTQLSDDDKLALVEFLKTYLEQGEPNGR